jgi:hypothetical protein
MADAAREHGRPHAAADVARDLLELARIARKPAVDPAKRTNGTSTNVRPSKEVS